MSDVGGRDRLPTKPSVLSSVTVERDHRRNTIRGSPAQQPGHVQQFSSHATWQALNIMVVGEVSCTLESEGHSPNDGRCLGCLVDITRGVP